MDNTRDVKLNIKLQLILVITIMIISLGVSYAFFDNIIHDNNSLATDGFSTGGLVLNYDGSSVISLNNIEPGLSVNKQFTVTNSSSSTVSTYNISFINLRNTLLIPDEFKYTITCTASSGSCSGKTVSSLPIESSVVLVGSSIAPGVTHTYTINLSFINTSSYQNYNQNKKIFFKIVIGNPKKKLVDALYEDYGSGDAISSETTVNNILGLPATASYTYFINNYFKSNSIYSSSSSGNVAVSTEFKFNEVTGYFQLTNALTNQKFSTDYIGYYTCGNYSTSCSAMYKIIGDIDTTTNPSYIYVHTLYYYVSTQITIGFTTSLNQTITTPTSLYSSTTGDKYVGTGFYVIQSGASMYVGLTNYSSNQRYSTSIGKYTLNNNYSTSSSTYTVGASISIWKILTVDTTTNPARETILTADVYTATFNKFNPIVNQNEDINKSGLYKTQDIDGTTNYFKGVIKNNVVSFAGLTWRVLRINGDGSIRLAKTAAINLSSPINNSSYCRNNYTDTNSNYYDCFKFGTIEDGEYSNRFESTTLSKQLRDWYDLNITSKYDKFLVKTKTCEMLTYNNSLDSNNIDFVLSSNFANNSYINYKCEMVNGSLGTHGENKILNMKVSYVNDTDRLLAGHAGYADNFLSTVATPYSILNKRSSGTIIFNNTNYSGGSSYYSTAIAFSINPVISLNPNVQVVGSGSLSDPYVVIEI